MLRLSPLWQLLAFHLVLVLGVQRTLPLGERLKLYPAEVAGLLSAQVLGQVGPLALLTGTYLGLGLALAWGGAALLSRAPKGVLWVLEGLPPYLLLVGGVGLGLAFTLWRGVNFPLSAWSPVMLALIAASLAVPAAARAALATAQARDEALRADHTRAARAMGLPEPWVQRRAARLALPERAAGLAGDALALALSLAVVEGLLQFPGVGNEVYLSLQGSFEARVPGGVVTLDGEGLYRAQVLSAAIAALLGLGVGYAGLLRGLAQRLDPRPRSGQEEAGA